MVCQPFTSWGNCRCGPNRRLNTRLTPYLQFHGVLGGSLIGVVTGFLLIGSARGGSCFHVVVSFQHRVQYIGIEPSYQTLHHKHTIHGECASSHNNILNSSATISAPYLQYNLCICSSTFWAKYKQ